MKRRILLIAGIIVIMIIAMLLLIFCNSNQVSKKIMNYIDRNCDENGTCYFTMDDIVDFKWDRLLMYNIGSSNEMISSLLDSKFNDSVDVSVGLIFVYKNKIVYKERHTSNVELPEDLSFYVEDDNIVPQYMVNTHEDASYKGVKEYKNGRYYYEIIQVNPNNKNQQSDLNNSKVTTTVLPSPIPTITDDNDDIPSRMTQYYDYTGDNLPDDIITPIDYIYDAIINKNFPEFKFEVIGKKVQSYNTTVNNDKYYLDSGNNKIDSIVVKCDELSYSQKLRFSETEIPTLENDTYGFELDDWNFDGYLDISLWSFIGGTSGNEPHYYWLWDNKKCKYVRCDKLEEISNWNYCRLDKKEKQIIADTKTLEGYSDEIYKWKDNEIVLIKTDEVTWLDVDPDTGMAKGEHHIVREKVNGKMKITDEYDTY